jgi:exodeoxyribonuclease-3
MRIISFNINGIRAIQKKGLNGLRFDPAEEKKEEETKNVLAQLIETETPDILCLQEIKTQSAADLQFLSNYFHHRYTNVAAKKGYSGVALLTNQEPEWVTYDFSLYSEERLGELYVDREFSTEGRIITAKFNTFVLVCVYTPNSQPKLKRLDERLAWEKVLRAYLKCLEEELDCGVVLCGDLNCAHQEIDLKNAKTNKGSPGFSKEERGELQKMLDLGFVDSFRFLHPNTVKYSWWSNFSNCREKNVGWRIDYFLVSQRIQKYIRTADCLTEWRGSDHGPVLLELRFE